MSETIRARKVPPDTDLDLIVRHSTPRPAEPLTSGYAHTCGVRDDGVAVCWGSNRNGKSSPPDYERFMSISSGLDHTCGLRDDGFVVCWGSNLYDQSSPPRDGSFTSISSGGDHTCGLRDDGFAVCWRGGWYSPPKDERFTSISTGVAGSTLPSSNHPHHTNHSSDIDIPAHLCYYPPMPTTRPLPRSRAAGAHTGAVGASHFVAVMALNVAPMSLNVALMSQSLR